MKLYNFDSIHVEIPKRRIYGRLGYREGITRVSSEQKEGVENYIKEAVSFIELKGTARRLLIKDRTPSSVTFEKDIVFKSKLLSSFLEKSEEAVFMAATAGKKIMNLVRKSGNKDMAKAVIFDAAASEMADISLNWIKDYLNQQLTREGKCLTKRRVSAGYGDFALKYQKKIYDILKLNKLGLKLTSTFMLVPEKSVTAVMGILNK